VICRIKGNYLWDILAVAQEVLDKLRRVVDSIFEKLSVGAIAIAALPALYCHHCHVGLPPIALLDVPLLLGCLGDVPISLEAVWLPPSLGA
jgi:hypothetical protein